MPELPEVQTTVNGLQMLNKKQITSIKINTYKLRYLIPKNIINYAQNKKILRIYRVAKYIIFQLNKNISLIFHLGMSGRIKLVKLADYNKQKHDHVLIYLNNNILIFHDPRKFGFFDFANTSELSNKKYFLQLGLDPFEKKLNKYYLLDKFSKSRSSIKQILLNQKVISGIGNIYACEILYDAKISPFIPCCELEEDIIERLLISIRKILNKAMLYGGTSLKDYSSTDGTLGNFQTKFKVYNKEGHKILNFTIKRVKQNNRSTFYCPNMQKSKYNPIS